MFCSKAFIIISANRKSHYHLQTEMIISAVCVNKKRVERFSLDSAWENLSMTFSYFLKFICKAYTFSSQCYCMHFHFIEDLIIQLRISWMCRRMDCKIFIFPFSIQLFFFDVFSAQTNNVKLDFFFLWIKNKCLNKTTDCLQ